LLERRQQFLMIYARDPTWLEWGAPHEWRRLQDSRLNKQPDLAARQKYIEALRAHVKALRSADPWRGRLRGQLEQIGTAGRRTLEALVERGATPDVLVEGIERLLLQGPVDDIGPRFVADTAKALREASGRLRRLQRYAHEIGVRGFFSDVPARLDAEASQLDRRAHLLKRTGEHFSAPGDAVLTLLQDHVIETTGRPCDNLLAALLIAAKVPGYRNVDVGLLAAQLEQKRRRRRRKNVEQQQEDLARTQGVSLLPLSYRRRT
jgi:hypothetical protein